MNVHPRYWICLTILLCASTSCTRTETARPWQNFTATAYAVEGTTASGGQTYEGHTVAADPEVLPPGTRIEVTDAGPYNGVYLVHDTGPKVKGTIIDIFLEDPKEAREFGRKPVRVRILDDGENLAGK